ncbi:MAG TPA: hypothetical protein PLZ86_00145 [bacterium]|nr:hypothetical protein [bacterium]
MAIESVVGKLSTEALGKAVVKSDEFAKPVDSSPFKEMLSQMDSGGHDFASLMGMTGHAQEIDPTSRMQALGAEGISFSPAEQSVGITDPAASEKVLDMLGHVNKGQMQMDTLVNHVLYSGKKFSNQELMVIQAHVFHFAQMSELTVKIAEQGVSSVKSVLNTQVQ